MTGGGGAVGEFPGEKKLYEYTAGKKSVCLFDTGATDVHAGGGRSQSVC